MNRNIVKFLVSVLVCQAAGAVGSLFTSPAIPTWYAALQKPSFNPPNWVFAPVWTTLFLLMGISLYLIWSKGLENRKVKIAIFIFATQLILNVFWSFLFFGLQSPLYAFIEIIILWLAILLTIISFRRISRIASLLFLPYILWVSFAGYLNYSIWTLNQETPVACTMGVKLCQDGSYVGRVPPDCDFAPCPKEESRTLSWEEQINAPSTLPSGEILGTVNYCTTACEDNSRYCSLEPTEERNLKIQLRNLYNNNTIYCYLLSWVDSESSIMMGMGEAPWLLLSKEVFDELKGDIIHSVGIKYLK